MFWLLKTEPGDYSFNDLLQEKKTVWSGVKNAAARKHLREMKAGDQLMIYHTGDEKAVVGLAMVVKPAYPDPNGKDEKAVAVEIAAGKRLKRPVTLAQIKAEKRFSGWALVRMGRLSVVPTTKGEWEGVMEMAG